MADEKSDDKEVKGGKSKLAFLENKAVVLGLIVVVQVVLAIGLTQFVILPRLGVQAAGVVEDRPSSPRSRCRRWGCWSASRRSSSPSTRTPGKPRYLRINVNLEVSDAAVARSPPSACRSCGTW